VDAEIRRLEEIVDSSALAPHLEAMLPVGVRPRQLRVHTLLLAGIPAFGLDQPGEYAASLFTPIHNFWV
jgi:hypothetical protein